MRPPRELTELAGRAENRYGAAAESVPPTRGVPAVPKVTYVRPAGDDAVIEAAEGTTVMQAAVAHGVSEIVAECGGTLACATCHVYVNEDQLDLLDPPSEDEDEMLDFTAVDRRTGSRLSCQITLAPTLDGLVVEVPAEQY